MVGYVYFAYRIARQTSGTPAFRALTLFTFFFVSIHFEAARFDDYHALVQLITLALISQLIPYLNEPGDSAPRRGMLLHAGLLIGVACMTRLNDGLALLGAYVLSYAARDFPSGLSKLPWLLLGTLLVFFLTLIAIGESPATWLNHSVLQALAIKGGDQAVFTAPLRLFSNSVAFVFVESGFPNWRPFLYLGIVAAATTVFICKKWRTPAAIAAILSGGLIYKGATARDYDIIAVCTAISIVVSFAFLFGLILRVAVEKLKEVPAHFIKNRKVKHILIVFPIALFSSASMSSGGSYHGLYFPFALLVLIFALLVEFNRRPIFQKVYWIQIFALLAVSGLLFRINNPYSWHSYRAAPLYAARTLVTTPGIGLVPMDASWSAAR